ncbi:MAG: betaine--homocysteine S-methyltransferase [Caldilinea sp.]|nr:betaine--homocysteine S-methyltransferase [Caldilineaceae bacterium]MCB9125181.1 betaine--homocysteine S-methyltransferase [Caldilineaceae bacterium]MCO5212249.1 betaine--homocysteine S-methyltransferase [Caldilinea sp.]MCW5844607.1 betaine--homocysteine S-methyltransferase [Caldilinea sp.]
MNKLLELLQSESVLLLDGAMGTELFARGLVAGGSPEAWNVEAPERVQDVHKAYVDAGSNIILTNSFGGTRYRLKLHDMQDRVVELNRAAAQNARAAAAAADHAVLVAGSMGPTGELLVPMGNMTYDECREAFAEQARGLVEGGVDILWVETMSDLAEVKAAVEGARSVAPDLPICATMSYDTRGRTMMGVTGAQMVQQLAALGLTAVGANCGNNLIDTEAALAEMHAAAPDMLLIAKANAGMPRYEGDKLIYDGTPDVMAAYADRVRGNGISLIGGCCGSGPAHIRMMRQVLDGAIPVPEVTLVPAQPAPEAAPARTRERRVRRG